MYNLTKPQKLIYNMEKFSGGSIATICSSILYDGKANTDLLSDAVNTLYKICDTLCTRICDTDDGAKQYCAEYAKEEIQVLDFNSKSEFDTYAHNLANEAMDMYGKLCDIRIVTLENQYGLLVKLHHIIGDAWTMSLIARTFDMLLKGDMPQIYSYADYIQSENEYVNSKRYGKDREYFLNQFKQCDEAVYLCEKESNNLQTSRKTFTINEQNTSLLTAYAAENDAGLFALFMTAFSVYMSRIKMNVEKFYVGTPLINRNGIKEQNTPGMFINTVPVLANINSDETFKEALQTMTDTTTSVMRHQRFNYEDILTELRKSYGFGEKLYDVVLSYQNAKTGIDGAKTEWYNCGMQSESLQIHIDDRDSEGILKIHYDYQTEKFTESEIEKLHTHLFNLLFDAIDNENKPIKKLEMLAKEEKHKLLYEFNDTKEDYPKDKCVHQLFEEIAKKNPYKEAVVACDKTLTYDELNKLSNRIANGLISKGVKKGDIVAFALPRKSYLIATMFGILKSGAAYMPLDPNYPQDRIDYMIEDSKAKFFITDSNFNEFVLDNEENPNVEMSQNDIYCALHTSGSTGKPKLALLYHKNLMAFLYANHRFYDGCDATISVTVVTFDVFMQDSVLSIAYGVKTILASEEQIYNQNDFEELFSLAKRALFFSTPTKLKNYISQSKTKDFMNHIGTFVVGGEVFPEELYNLIVSHFNNAKCYNGYGPTETTLCNACSCYPPPKNI